MATAYAIIAWILAHVWWVIMAVVIPIIIFMFRQISALVRWVWRNPTVRTWAADAGSAIWEVVLAIVAWFMVQRSRLWWLVGAVVVVILAFRIHSAMSGSHQNQKAASTASPQNFWVVKVTPTPSGQLWIIPKPTPYFEVVRKP